MDKRVCIVDMCVDKGSSFTVLAMSSVSACLIISRRSRQRERLNVSMLSICSSVCLSVCRQNANNAIFSEIKQFRAMVSIDDL